MILNDKNSKSIFNIKIYCDDIRISQAWFDNLKHVPIIIFATFLRYLLQDFYIDYIFLRISEKNNPK